MRLRAACAAQQPAREGLRARLTRLRRTRWWPWAADALLIAAVLAGASLWQTRAHLRGPAPEARLRLLDGTPFALSQLRGRPALIAFWAPWCAVCKVESQNLSWVRSLAGDRAQVVTVAAAFDDPQQVADSARARGVDYPVLLGDDRLLRAFGVSAFPTVFFLDAEGRVKSSASGYTTTLGLLWRLFF